MEYASAARSATPAESKEQNPGSRPPSAQITATRHPAAPLPVSARSNGKDTEIADGSALEAVRAPIPGVIVSLAIEPGTTVSTGQELCVLEAMKMKNSIRAARAGQIAAIHVTPGQAVKHRDVLMEFKD
jgi:biotin carboxyl carrier protein